MNEALTNFTSEHIEVSTMSEYNILLLGESGVGKTTAINAFVNYLKYVDFEDLKSGELIELISSKFTLPNPNSGDALIIDTTGNADQNDIKVPKSYSFKFGNRLIRFIDTPGFDDTSNLDKIFEYLRPFKMLNAICIFIKSTTNTVTASFHSFHNELFIRLHQNACKNIIVGFTFSRSTAYGPADGFVVLKKFFQENIANFVLDFNINCFFIDNDAYRFMLAKREGYSFLDDQEVMIKENWNNSALQTLSIILSIFDLEPYYLKQSFVLNDVVKLFNLLNCEISKLGCKLKSKLLNIGADEKNLKNLIESSNILVEIDEINKAEIDIEQIEKSIFAIYKEVDNCRKEIIELEGIQYRLAGILENNSCLPFCLEFKIGKDEKIDDALKNLSVREDVQMKDFDKFLEQLSQLEYIGPDLRQFLNSLNTQSENIPVGIEINENFSLSIDEPITSLTKSFPPIPEYNILLLSETGAGKSTTINAFANYLKYSNFDEATANEFVQLIPSKFTLPHPETGDPMVIESGSDQNECHEFGNSSTQSPLGYVFQFGDKQIRLIDTPGMGDTNGVDVDNLNFDKILSYLHNIKNLHGIIILIKATETRKTASFRYCINELLTHLHKSACKNILFCFTFSRNSFYGPGEGFQTLNAFLKNELIEVNLELKSNVNCFYIDNESYRFLVAKKQNYPFIDGQQNIYKESWNKSVQQTNRMMECVVNLKPHKLADTCSLNEARKLILDLSEPMVKLQANINENINHIKSEENRIMNSKESIDKLVQNLHIEVDDLVKKPLSHPMTVCTADKCTEAIQFQGIIKINYKTKCHENCRVRGMQISVVSHPNLKYCSAFNKGKSKFCVNCGCPWEKHMHIDCEYEKVKRSVIDVNTQNEIMNKEDSLKLRTETVEKLKLLVAEYEEELKVIQAVSSKFAYVLISNSNTPYNKFNEPYLNLLIDEEQKKINAIANYSRTMYDSLIQMKQTHRENVRILTEAINNQSHEEINIENIEQYRDELLQLKHSGRQFCQMLEATNLCRQQEFKFTERSVNVDPKSSGFLSNLGSSLVGKSSGAFNRIRLFVTRAK